MADDQSTTINIPTLASDAHRGQRVSLVVYHRDGAQAVPLLPGSPRVVGRARPSDLAIPDASLSREHARFTFDGDAIWVEDLGSTNGTKVDGKKVKRSRVKPGAEVQLGTVSASIHQHGSATPELAGVESHDRLMILLEHEIARARTFRSTFGVLMVREAKHDKAHLAGWCPRVQRLLRPVDVMAVYGPSAVMILAPELSLPQATELAGRILDERERHEPALLCGVGAYPASATSPDELVAVVREAALRARGRNAVEAVASETPGTSEGSRADAIAVSAKMKDVFRTVERVAASQLAVLLEGETGTGKEVVASAIHRLSGRKGAMRCVNCGAIPAELTESILFGHERGAFTGASQQSKGLFEQAHRGTILLDEIGELPPSAQAALLRVIETKRVTRIGSTKEIEVDVRVIAATHRDLEQMCEANSFRLDLLYRLNTMKIELPALRERPEDVLPLAKHFTKLANEANRTAVGKIDPAAQRLLKRYAWPGNVRELRNVIERAVVIAHGDTIMPTDLSARVRDAEPKASAGPPTDVETDVGQLDVKGKLQRYEAQLLAEALEQHGWNQSATAKALDIPRRTLVHKIKQYGLKRR